MFRRSESRMTGRGLWALALACVLVSPAAGAPLPTTTEDFRLPGTQPLTVIDNFALPSDCTSCHADYGQPTVEPFRNWQGSMMAQSGRDPLMWAALAIANQDAPQSGETCLRCHLPKGWLEGRSAPADGTAMTADDRQGVQCNICHRMLDPFADPQNPPQDAAILADLSAPVTELASAMFVLDPLDRLRGPFGVVADLGSDPHIPDRTTLLSPFHKSSELCGVCHNVRNPLFSRDPNSGEYVLNAFDAQGDPALAFPEQSTYDEWAASAYASTGVFAPQFGLNKDTVSSCQDCHMPDVSGRDAEDGLDRDDIPRHELVGANTFIPDVLPQHPFFGPEVDASILQEGIERATDMLRRAATVTLDLAGDKLSVRVTNESGHKLPTGYPEGRRMWLHVRAFDDNRNIVFESGRYVFSTATLTGYGAELGDPNCDPYLQVWESRMGMSPDVAALAGLPAGESFHLVLNNLRLKDNRIPPRGFTNAAYAAFGGEPVGASYADGQYWDEVVYPVGTAAVQADVTLYYQTASRGYIEFLRDENTTTAAGNLLFDLWDQYNKSVPVVVARAFFESDTKTLNRCHKNVAKVEERYRRAHMKAWAQCFETEAGGLPCDTPARDARIAAADAKLRERLGGPKDKLCTGRSLTPISLGHGTSCPVPCSTITLFDISDLASCAVCMADAVNGTALEAAYGARLPDLPAEVPDPAKSCQKSLGKAASALAQGWPSALVRCEQDNLTGKNNPPEDCATDPDARIAKAQQKADKKIQSCQNFSDIAGCATSGDAAGTRICMQSAVGSVAPEFVEVSHP